MENKTKTTMVLVEMRLPIVIVTIIISLIFILTLPSLSTTVTAMVETAMNGGRNVHPFTPAASNKEWRINEKIRRKFLTVQRTLDCHERSFTFKAVRTDPETGLQCRDYIRLLSCWGRCSSGEISDYRFPYKRSFHNVCIHDLVEKRRYELTDCDPGAPESLRSYEAMVARRCVCRRCETSSINCESSSIDLDYI
uniref:Thyrostimulin beta-5 subunit-like n=1 Tax=Dermatophagoides pteronyssinus TaxID=6956 RepID=A0A6P6Y3H0_DERPT|nr:thyrostimulin beta-5 subunit-like [Dermatophagoides pteronyssinus]